MKQLTLLFSMLLIAFFIGCDNKSGDDANGSETGNNETTETTSTNDGDTSESSVSPKDEIIATINEMIELIEEEKFRELLENHADPEFVQDKIDSGEFDMVVENFTDTKAAELKDMLMIIKDQEPEATDDSNVYKFANEERDVFFKKVDGKWYLMN
jgi:hypothetical protein